MENIDEVMNLIDSREKKETMNLLIKYLKKWPFFVFFSVAGFVLGYLHYKNSPNIFEVKNKILIIEEDNNLSSVLSFNNPSMPMGGGGNKASIENQIGIINSYTLHRKALINLDWEYSWYLKKPLYNADLYGYDPLKLIIPPNGMNAENVQIQITPLNKYGYNIVVEEGHTAMNGYSQFINIDSVIMFDQPFVNEFFNFTIKSKNQRVGDTYILNFNNINSLTSQYLGTTQIFTIEKSSDLVSIMIQGESRERAADFINELTKVFIDFGMENKSQNSENSVQFIDSQLSRIKKSLGTAEENFSNYRKNNQVMNLGQEAQIVYQKLEEIEQEQYLTQLQIDYYTNLQQYLDNSEKIEEMINPSIVGITDANLSGMLSRLMDLYSRREVLSYSVQEKNPTLIVVEKEIRVTRDGLEETLKNQLEATQSKLESLQERHSTIQARLKKLPETEKTLIGIQREFDLNNELYTYMLQKKAEASISKASIQSQVQVVDNAIVEASGKVGPSKMVNIGGGFVGGFMIPFVIITLLGFFNTKIETKEEIEKGSRIPVLEGVVKHKYKVNLPVIHHPRSGITESFRGVKSNLNAILERPGSKVVSINSLIPGEGKSFISSNFSAILTKSNKTVLLIGSDLHKPTLHTFLGVEEDLGLSNFLKDEVEFEKIISKTSVPKLDFIQAGPVPPNPSDLLDNMKFENLIIQARKMYDYIIIDNAPLLLVPDAVLTSRFSDVSLFILRIGYSHKDQIKQINKIVDFNKIKHSAIVINETPDRGYGYGNKYWKKGYGEYKK